MNCNSDRNIKSIIIIISLIFLLSLITTLFSGPAQARSDLDQINRDLSETQKKIEEKEKEASDISSQIEQIDHELNQSQSELDSLSAKLSVIQSDLHKTEELLEEAKQELESLIENLRETKAKLKEQQELLQERVTNFYKNGKLQYVEVVFQAKSFNDFINRISFLELIIEQDVNIHKKIAGLKAKIEKEKTQQEKVTNEINSHYEEIKNQEDEMKVVVSQKQIKKNQINSDLKKKENLLGEIEADKEELEKQEQRLLAESNAIEAQLRNISGTQPVSVSPGGFIWPVNGSLSSGFGMRLHPILGDYRMHTGIDIGAGYGTPIKASKDGIVIFSGWKGGYGNTVIINHGGGIATLYAHASSIAVGSGSQVSQGQAIAYVGSTGYSTGPHLHFEVRLNGTPQNPMNYLP